MIRSARADWGIRSGGFSLEDFLGGKVMAVRKMLLILCVLVAAFALFLAIHFAGHAAYAFEHFLAVGLMHIAGR